MSCFFITGTFQKYIAVSYTVPLKQTTEYEVHEQFTFSILLFNLSTSIMIVFTYYY